MFFLILVSILAVVSTVLGAPTLEATSTTFNNGAIGGFGYSGDHGNGYGALQGYGSLNVYGSPHRYENLQGYESPHRYESFQGYGFPHRYQSLQGYGTSYGDYPPPHINRLEGLSNVHIPGRQTFFTPFVSQSPSFVYSPEFGTSLRSSSQRDSFIPQRSLSQSYQMYNIPADSCPAQEALIPIKKVKFYHSAPYYEIIDTYKFYNISNGFLRKKANEEFYSDSNIELDVNNKNIDSSQQLVTSEDIFRENIPKKAEPVLQLTYLGYVPQSSFKSASQSITADEAGRQIPFYVLDYDDETPGTRRSSSGSPPMYVSPVRLYPASGVYPRRNIGRSALSPLSSVPHRISYRELPPYTSYYRSPSQHDQSGYYLIDVKPVADDPILGSPRPTLYPLIQTLTGLMGGPIGEMPGPSSRGLNANTQSQTRGENENKEKLTYKPVYEAQVPEHNTFQSDEEIPVQTNDGKEQQETDIGLSTQSVGSRDFEDNLVRHLIAVRSTP